MSNKLFKKIEKGSKVLVNNICGIIKPEHMIINAIIIVDYNMEDELIDQLDSHDYEVIELKEKENKDTALIKLKIHTYSYKEREHVIDELYMHRVIKIQIEENEV